MTEKVQPDWERIEADYRAGTLSLREIAKLHPGTDHVAISRRAKKHGWVQDLSAKIEAKAQQLVTQQVVTPDVTGQRLVTEKQVIESNAKALADVRIGHRADIARARTLALSLLGELEALTGQQDLFAELGDILRSEDDKGNDKRNDIYRKVIASAGRVDSMKKLAETLNIVISLERKAWGIVEGGPGSGEPADNLAVRMEAARKRARGNA